MENSEEYSPYLVKETKKDGLKGFELVFRDKELNEELIFAMKPDKSGVNRAWVDYWCLRLNRAFIDGWFGAKGVPIKHDSRHYEELDRLFKKMTSF